MTVQTLFPTKPLDCWPKMKELRREHHRRNQRTMDSGGVVIVGIVEQFLSLPAGLGEYATWQYEPRFTQCMRDPQEAIKNFEAIEAHGYGRDLCNSLRVHMGGVLRGRLDAALRGRKPDFIFQWELCPFAIKTAAFVAERYGVPWITLDIVDHHRPGPVDQRYIIDQMHEAIAEMEKVTGRRYDDERLISALRNEWECAALWAKTCYLTRAIPAPIDFRMCQSLRIPLILDRDKAEVVAFYRELYDEVKARVAAGISARGREDARLLYEGFVTFHTPPMLRWPEHYGAIFVGGRFSFNTFGVWTVHEDGRWEPATPPWERGLALRTRDDALRALADLYLGNETERRSAPMRSATRVEQVLRRAEDWHADGVIMGMERRCRVQFLTQMEQMAALQAQGTPCIEFEPSSADFREFDTAQVYSRVSAFMEGLGLQKVRLSEAPQDDD